MQRSRIRLVIGVAVLVALIGAAVAWRLLASLVLDEGWAAFREAGYPTTLEEFRAYYPAVPDDENGAPALLEALDNLISEKDFHHQFLAAQIPPYTKEVLDEDSARYNAFFTKGLWEGSEEYTEFETKVIAEYVAANADTLDAVEEALKESRYRFPIEGIFESDDTDSQLGHLTQLGLAANLFEDRAFVQLKSGDARGLASSLEAGYRIGRVLRMEPLENSQMCRSSCNSRACGTLEYVMSRVQLSMEDIDRLRPLVVETACYECWERGIAGDAFATVAFHRDFSDRSLVSPLIGLIGIADRGVPRFLSQAYESAANTKEPWYISDPKIESFIDGMEFPSAWEILTDLPYSFSRFAYELSPITASSDATNALNAGTALAVEKFRLTRGHLPDSLADLVPDFIDDIPVDPFTGEALLYTRLDVGYEVGSRGYPTAFYGGRGRHPIMFRVAR